MKKWQPMKVKVVGQVRDVVQRGGGKYSKPNRGRNTLT